MILEACVGTVEDAIRAENNGAHQLELCDRLDLDGTSPPIELIKAVMQKVSIPVKVIVNPKPFDYTYSHADLSAIADYLAQLAKLPLAGIVFGALANNKMPDLKAIEFVSQKYAGPITFHKAIDKSDDIITATKMLADQNLISFILSSGGKETAAKGLDVLQKMKDTLMENKSSIKMIAAGKINATNLKEIHHKIDFSYYHGKKIVEK